MISIFCDGGCIVKNPSIYGGTWCYVLVEDNKSISTASGIILPNDVGLPAITNNLSELFAALKGLAAAPTGWQGALYTDSLITLRRITTGEKFNGIPQKLREKTLELRRGRKWQGILLSGHPTKAQLEIGIGRKGRPVSKWNVYCDQECKRLATEFMKGFK